MKPAAANGACAVNAYICRHGDRLTIIIAADLIEAYDRARPFLAGSTQDSVELRRIGPVYDAAHVRFDVVGP